MSDDESDVRGLASSARKPSRLSGKKRARFESKSAREDGPAAPSAAAAPPSPAPPPMLSDKSVSDSDEMELGGGSADGMAELAEAPAEPKPAKDGGYEALQRSMGDRGALPVGIRNNVHASNTLQLEGALYPAGGTPAVITLLVYDPAARSALDLGLGILAFFLTVVTLDLAVRKSWRLPFFLVLTLLPMAGYGVEWLAGVGSVDCILAGIAFGFAGAAARMARRG